MLAFASFGWLENSGGAGTIGVFANVISELNPFISQTPPSFMRIVTLHDETKVRVLLSESDIQQGVKRLADDIAQQYGKEPLTIIGVMTGSIILLADLIRMLELPLRVGVVQTSSYRSGTERGELRINDSMMLDIRDRDVLLIDDIFDTGHTLSRVVERVQQLGPSSLRSAVLLSKTGRQEVSYCPDFVTFDIPDEFVIGYGLDYDDEYRNLPYIGCLDEIPGARESE